MLPFFPRAQDSARAATALDLPEITAEGRRKACQLHFNLVCIGKPDGSVLEKHGASSREFKLLDVIRSLATHVILPQLKAGKTVIQAFLLTKTVFHVLRRTQISFHALFWRQNTVWDTSGPRL